MIDVEINAMSECTDALTKLNDNAARARVLQYLISRFEIIAPQNNYIPEMPNNLISTGQQQHLPAEGHSESIAINDNEDYPMLKDIVMKDLPKTEAEWILIFVFYASEFGKHPTTKDDIIGKYREAGKYSETNRKNFVANVARCVKNNWIKSLDKDSYIILSEGRDYITEILAGRSKGKTRPKLNQRKRLIKANNK